MISSKFRTFCSPLNNILLHILNLIILFLGWDSKRFFNILYIYTGSCLHLQILLSFYYYFSISFWFDCVLILGEETVIYSRFSCLYRCHLLLLVKSNFYKVYWWNHRFFMQPCFAYSLHHMHRVYFLCYALFLFTLTWFRIFLAFISLSYFIHYCISLFSRTNTRQIKVLILFKFL